MKSRSTIETLTSKPPCGLSIVDWALIGSKAAQLEVVESFPQMGVKSPSGLTPMEWAALGLQSAREVLNQLLTVE